MCQSSISSARVHEEMVHRRWGTSYACATVIYLQVLQTGILKHYCSTKFRPSPRTIYRRVSLTPDFDAIRIVFNSWHFEKTKQRLRDRPSRSHGPKYWFHNVLLHMKSPHRPQARPYESASRIYIPIHPDQRAHHQNTHLLFQQRRGIFTYKPTLISNKPYLISPSRSVNYPSCASQPSIPSSSSPSSSP